MNPAVVCRTYELRQTLAGFFFLIIACCNPVNYVTLFP